MARRLWQQLKSCSGSSWTDIVDMEKGVTRRDLDTALNTRKRLPGSPHFAWTTVEGYDGKVLIFDPHPIEDETQGMSTRESIAVFAKAFDLLGHASRKYLIVVHGRSHGAASWATAMRNRFGEGACEFLTEGVSIARVRV